MRLVKVNTKYKKLIGRRQGVDFIAKSLLFLKVDALDESDFVMQQGRQNRSDFARNPAVCLQRWRFSDPVDSRNFLRSAARHRHCAYMSRADL
jgi:hypothetical protein